MAGGYQGDWVFSKIMEDRANSFADKNFLLCQDDSYTYAEVCDRAARVAAGLATLMDDPAVPVATMLDSSPMHIFVWFGCAWAGVIEVPINTEFKGTFLEHVLNESEAPVLVIEPKYVPRLKGLNLRYLRHVVLAGRPEAAALADTGPVSLAQPQHALPDWFTLPPAPRVPRDESDLVYILYTSGTTGPSKGATHCHRSALWTARVWHEMFEMEADDVGYSFLPLFHTTARNVLVANALIAGASVALRERFSVREFWRDVSKFGATYFAYMGAIIQMLWNQEPVPGEEGNPLRVGGGAAAPPAITDAFEKRFGVRLIEVYGMTEIGTASGHRINDIVRGTMGKPFGHLELEIHDPHDNAVPAGIPGEIVVRPREPWAITQGYWKNPEATVEAWRNLWFHSGDLGKLTEDGYLIYLDRVKDSLRRRGENISSFEVERAVLAHPAVAEAAVYDVASELTEDEVMVAVVLRPEAPFDPGEFFRFCADTMPRFAVPRYVRLIAELPKTPTARVEKYKLRDQGVTPDTMDREKLAGA